MRVFLSFIIVLLLFFPVIVFSQELKGKVLNESGGNAAGVMVRFQSQSKSSITKADGTFKIMTTRLPDTLVFSAVGMEPYKVVISEKNIKDPNFEVVLLNKRKALKKVAVASSGETQPGKELTYSAVTAKEDQLSGKVSGVKVSSEYASGSDPSKIIDPKYGSAPSGPADLARSYFFRDTMINPREGTLAKSKILTAGEVNDFNKWKMWEDFSENEFKSLSVFWGMKTNNRYCVQLTDKKHHAVMNEAVFLINKNTSDTVWRTCTDNTGKAELWAGFLDDSTEIGDCYISDSYGNTVFNPVEFVHGINVLTIDRSCQVSDDVDIAFVVDATGSMRDEIEFLKLELEDVVRNILEKYQSLNLRASSVFYRDKSDEYLARTTGFKDDLLKTLNFIKLQRASGGGDYPEAVDHALGIALDSLQWNKNTRTKILFLVLDAPPHKEAIKRMQELTVKAAVLGIRIVPIACSGTDKPTEFLLRSMALATNGTYTFLTDQSGVGNNHIEPTTDKYEVELLNNLLQRIISQLLYARDCNKEDSEQEMQEETNQPGNIRSIKIYPDPSSGQFTVETNKDIKEIFITDFTGKILMRLISADKIGKWKADISSYPSGVYMVKYITTDNKWGAGKVILKR